MFLTVERLTHVYLPGTPFAVTALREISLTIHKGEFVGLIGQTGSGKSTLIQHFNGLLKPASGRILLEGHEVVPGKGETQTALRRRIGLLFQFPEQQLFEETVLADVAFGPRNMGHSREEAEALAANALQAVGLAVGKYADRSPFSLSGGEMRRVAIAGILAMKPEMLVLDEPLAGLDPRGKRETLDLVAALRRERELTVVLVSHSMEEVARYADRLFVLSAGELTKAGTPAEVFSDAERLEQLGLALPQLAQLMRKLQQAGKNVPADAFTVERAKQAILAMLHEEKHKRV
jgi:energy-coupling factor transport system ATP-binding protein